MISIVTAFYDIGRSDWKAFHRSADTYFSAFERMCQLDNDIILFTSENFKSRVSNIQKFKKNLTVYYIDIFSENTALLERIAEIQTDVTFREGIVDPSSPEYWEPRYILINYLKSYFCLEAYKRIPKINNKVAWIDFGYCRKDNYIPLSKKWDYDFEDKIHLFNLLDIDESIDIVHTIKHNKVYIQGCHIVAHKDGWIKLNKLVSEALENLMKNTLIDDDQTLLLMAYLNSKEDFALHKANINTKLGWFFIFKHYNKMEYSFKLISEKILSLFKSK